LSPSHFPQITLSVSFIAMMKHILSPPLLLVSLFILSNFKHAKGQSGLLTGRQDNVVSKCLSEINEQATDCYKYFIR
jgi:hypothetical protein